MAKSSRFKQSYRKNASKLHKAVGDMLAASPLLCNYRIYQEYPVNKISPYFDSGREKFDWVILDLMVVIECHGKQHYEPVRFGGITEEEATDKYREQVIRDLKKKHAAEKAGFTYVVYRYDEKDISASSLMAKIVAVNEAASNLGVCSKDRNMVSQQVREKSKPKRNKSHHEEQLKRAREYRKQQYAKRKQWQHEHS